MSLWKNKKFQAPSRCRATFSEIRSLCHELCLIFLPNPEENILRRSFINLHAPLKLLWQTHPATLLALKSVLRVDLVLYYYLIDIVNLEGLSLTSFLFWLKCLLQNYIVHH